MILHQVKKQIEPNDSKVNPEKLADVCKIRSICILEWQIKGEEESKQFSKGLYLPEMGREHHQAAMEAMLALAGLLKGQPGAVASNVVAQCGPLDATGPQAECLFPTKTCVGTAEGEHDEQETRKLVIHQFQ